MAHRLVTIVDTDVNLATHLQGELARWGLTVEVVADANDLMSRKDDLPELVVLCIDPKRTGWAVCNRLRKSPFLKSVPLIITSAEATEKDFDDHKKLKTRAEEYLHKPFVVESLVDKIGGLIGMPAHEEVDAEISEIDIEPEVVGEELGGNEYRDEHTLGGRSTPQTGFEGGEDESTRTGFVSDIDGEVDLETNAAFAAIGLDAPAEQDASRPPAASPFDDEPFEPENTANVGGVDVSLADEIEPEAIELPADADSEFDVPSHVSTPIHHSAPADVDSAPIPRLDPADLGLDLDDVARDAAQIHDEPVAPPQRGAMHAPDSAALEEAHREVERLRRELDELRSKAKETPTSFSREREFLNLRETINKKEKEVLDLKDAVDARDRLVLDGKEKLRDAERKLREFEERSLAMEREHVAAKEKLEAFSTEKEQSAARETQLQRRLDDVQKALSRAETEIESWRTRHAADTGALDEKLNALVVKNREELGMLRQSHAEALVDQKAEHTSAMGKQREQHDAAVSSLRTEHEASISSLKGEHVEALGQADARHRAQLDTELKAAEHRHGEALGQLESRHGAALADAQTRSQEQLRALADEAARTLAQTIAAHDEDEAQLSAEHNQRIEALRAEQEEALEQAAAQAQQMQQQALAALASTHDEVLKTVRDQHQRKIETLEETHEDLKAGMNARHATQVKDLHEQHNQSVVEYDAAIAERDGIIAQQREQHSTLESALADEQTRGQNHTRRIGELETELEATRNDASQRTRTINQRDARIAELEQESARYQDQILRAYQRIKSDESIVQRAKKALAIALTLLEESDDKPEEASS